MSRVTRKPFFCVCENKDSDKLCTNCTADQRLCFRYNSTSLIQNVKPRGCAAPFASDPVDRFPHDEARIM